MESKCQCANTSDFIHEIYNGSNKNQDWAIWSLLVSKSWFEILPEVLRKKPRNSFISKQRRRKWQKKIKWLFRIVPNSLFQTSFKNVPCVIQGQTTVRLKPRQRTKLWAPNQTDLTKPVFFNFSVALCWNFSSLPLNYSGQSIFKELDLKQ